MNIKERALTVVTAISAAFHGMIALSYYGDGPVSGDMMIWVALVAPFTITVVMVWFPRPFKEQCWSWFRGMSLSAVLSSVLLYGLLVYDNGFSVLGVFVSLYLGLMVTLFGSVIFSCIAFFLGSFINVFQEKPDSQKRIIEVFE